MQDRPSREEFLVGIARFLETDVVPALGEPLRFHTRVAANLLKIIERELHLEGSHLQKEAEGLRALLSRSSTAPGSTMDLKQEIREMNQELCRRIREGQADQSPWGQEVFQHLKRTVIQKLEIANPPMIEKALTKY
ncbi:MAG TPA: DUF6285 domain-containing protein [Thermodesulfobacteriota bacterium]|nr:DUF6285 domain-containing protein [Thermodesulfobacteriota bacterium]